MSLQTRLRKSLRHVLDSFTPKRRGSYSSHVMRRATSDTLRPRLEPLEDRRMLSVTLFVDADAPAGGDGLAWATAYDNLQSALESAAAYNADAIAENDVDAIWIAEGVYTPSAELEPGDSRSASFSLVDGVAVYGGFAGTETAPAERDPAAKTILSGDVGVLGENSDNAYSVVRCGEGVMTRLDGVTVTGGNANGDDAESGGGILVGSMRGLTIADCTLTGNRAVSGGGLHVRGNVTLLRSTVRDNTATNAGGIYVGNSGDAYGTLTLIDSTVSHNTVTNSGGGIFNQSAELAIHNSTLSGNAASESGGGIYNAGTLTIIRSTLSGNELSTDHSPSGAGGAVYNAGTLTIEASTLCDNAAAGQKGGAIMNYEGSVTIDNSTVSGNTAASGAGIYVNAYNETASLTMTNSTISGNVAAITGGGIYSYTYGSTVRLNLLNVTVTENTGTRCSGIGSTEYGGYEWVTMQNTIVAGNTAASDGEFNGTLTVQSRSNFIGGDPMLGPLADNGGPTATHVPLPGSPVIDGGNDDLISGYTDQRGSNRFFGISDIGSTEYQPDLLPVAYRDAFDVPQDSDGVTVDPAANDELWGQADCQVCIAEFPEHGNLVLHADGTVTYAPEPGFYGTDFFSYVLRRGTDDSNEAAVALSVLSPESIVVSTAVDELDDDRSAGDLSLREALEMGERIQFSGVLCDARIILTDTLELSGIQEIFGLGSEFLAIDANGGDGVFDILPDAEVVVDNLTMTGTADNGNQSALYNQGTLTMTAVSVSKNEGHGVFNTGYLSITDSIVSRNEICGFVNAGTLEIANSVVADNGLRLQPSGAGIANDGTVTITGSTFVRNYAMEGGVVWNRLKAICTVSDSVFFDNYAENRGGAVFNDRDGLLSVQDCLISGNTSRTGGGICNDGATVITNSVLIGNSGTQGGAVFNQRNLIVTNSTIVENKSRGQNEGGGIYQWRTWGRTTLNNTIVAQNTAYTGDDIFREEGRISGSHNLIGDGSGQTAFTDGENGNIVGTAETPVDPRFLRNPSPGTDGTWGTEDDDYGDLRLLPTSPAIDAGDNALAVDAEGNPLSVDFAGSPRMTGGTVDIGAYESPEFLPGDLNLDRIVNSTDLDLIRGNWGRTVSPGSLLDGDPSGDGYVGSADLDIIRGNWGATAPAAGVSAAEGRAVSPREEMAEKHDETDAVVGHWNRARDAWAEAVEALARERKRDMHTAPRTPVNDLAMIQWNRS